MYKGLLDLHNLMRWVALILIVVAIVKAAAGQRSGQPYAGIKKWALFTLIAFHLQFVIGLILFFVSPIVDTAIADMGAAMSNKVLRFFSVEHTLLMLIAIILVTVGYSRAKKLPTDRQKHKSIFTFFLIALLVVLAAVPWPFRDQIGRTLIPGM